MLWRDTWKEFDTAKVLQWVVLSSTYQVFELSRVNYISFLFARSISIGHYFFLETKLRGKKRQEDGLWKVIDLQISDSHFVTKLKNHTVDTLLNIDLAKISNNQFRWELLKYKIGKFSGVLAQISRQEMFDLENRWKQPSRVVLRKRCS